MRHYRTFFSNNTPKQRNCNATTEVTFKILEDLLELHIERKEPKVLNFDIGSYTYKGKSARAKGTLHKAEDYFIFVFKGCPSVLEAFSLAYDKGLDASLVCFGYELGTHYESSRSNKSEVIIHLFPSKERCRCTLQ
jgi:hypothetical protein